MNQKICTSLDFLRQRKYRKRLQYRSKRKLAHMFLIKFNFDQMKLKVFVANEKQHDRQDGEDKQKIAMEMDID